MGNLTESVVFDRIAEELEQATSLNRLQARGTMRLVLKEMGLRSEKVNMREMQVVVAGPVFRRALEVRGMAPEETAEVGRRLVGNLKSVSVKEEKRHDTPEEVFKRIAGLGRRKR